MSESKLNADLEKLISTLLKEASKKPAKDEDPMPLEDRLKIIDRALKMEQLKLKVAEEEFGTGFDDDTPTT